MDKLVVNITEELFETVKIPIPGEEFDENEDFPNTNEECENFNTDFGVEDDDIVTM